MSLNKMDPELREVFKEVAKRQGITIKECYKLYSSVWATVYHEMSSNSKPVNIVLKHIGTLRLRKSWQELVMQIKCVITKEEKDEFIRD